MLFKLSISFVVILPIFLSFNSEENISPERQWSQYRGYDSNGTLDNANLPEIWDVSENENINQQVTLFGAQMENRNSRVGLIKPGNMG